MRGVTMYGVVGITGDADMYHVSCAREVYGSDTVDNLLSGYAAEYDKEGNMLGIVFADDAYDVDSVADKNGVHAPYTCGHCLSYLVEDSRELVVHNFPDMGCYADSQGACFTQCDTANEWPDWDGIEECTCGVALPEVCDGSCPECGREYWTLVAPVCSECDVYISGDYWLCLDGGDVYCTACVTVE